MKKRILSVLLVGAMLLALSVSSFAAVNEDAVLDKAGSVLDEVNYDATTGEWQKDIDYHAAQIAAIEDVNSIIDTADISEAIDMILEHDGLTVNQKLYLCALAKANDPAIGAVLALNNTAGLTWKQTFNPLKDFANTLEANTTVIAPPGAPDDVVAEYARIIDEDGAEREMLEGYIEDVIKNLLKIAFSSTSTDLEDSYQSGVAANDITKKTIMIFASEVAEKEGISFRTSSSLSALASAGKDYALNFKNDSNIALAKDAVELVAGADYEDTFDVAFELAANGVIAVNSGYFVGRDIFTDIQLLVGNDAEKGIVEIILNAVDEDYKASNMLLNIALEKGIQIHRPAGRIADIKENPAFVQTLGHESSISVKTEGVSFRGKSVEPVVLKTNWFDIEFYKENGEKLGGATYDDGQVSIIKNESRGVENAYMVLYRKDAAGDELTFIETYPVKVDFTDGITLPSPGSSSSVTRYTVTFNTNGGSAIASAKYANGTTVQLTMKPTKEGYIFTGWYSDAELTQKIDSIKVDKDVTIYAGWKKDGSAVVSKVEIPELLEGGEHYAYVMGYPDGNILPNGNITRAEAVTMIFRMLKDDVRTANLTKENAFEDVNADDWFNTAVSTLAKLGIVNGRTETTFDPNANITRAEFATMFARLAEYEYVAENKYGDVDHHWSKKFIEEVDAYGWIAGYEEETFRPDNKITRAEAMTLINRVLKRTPEAKADLLEGMTTWADNADENAWYYLAVQEATNSHEYERKENGFEKWTKLAENKDWTTFEK